MRAGEGRERGVGGGGRGAGAGVQGEGKERRRRGVARVARPGRGPRAGYGPRAGRGRSAPIRAEPSRADSPRALPPRAYPCPPAWRPPVSVSSTLSSSASNAPFSCRPQSNRTADIESLERENDANIELLGERVGLLKNVTAGIRGEVQEHHALLDRMAMGMTGLQLGLGATVSKLQTVMRDPNRRPTFLAAIGLAFALFFLYLYLRA